MTPCEICRGACCESVAFNLPAEMPQDVLTWLEYHNGTLTPRNGGKIELRMATPCVFLSAGRCSIYAERPQVCHDFIMGGSECRERIRQLRDADTVKAIEALF